MRIAGYLLLALGLLSISFSHYAYLHGAKLRALAFTVPLAPEGRAYDASEVREVVRRALDEMGRNMPSTPPTAVMMVAGAVLLDIAGRGKRKAQNA
jgi:hypothetical protein